MKPLIWDDNKIKELNAWIKDDSTSSIGAVILELKEVINLIERGEQFAIIQNNKHKSIVDRQAFTQFIRENLINPDYFINELE